MLITSCMRSASTSMHEFLRGLLNLQKMEMGVDSQVSPKKGLRSRPHRDWRGGEGVEGYMHYPSSSAIKIPSDILTNWVTDRSILVQEHLLPIPYHRNILMKIPKDQRKVVVMKRNADESFESQMARNGECHYDSRGSNSNKCLAEFRRFREDIEIMFPEEDGFLHIEFNDVIHHQDREIKRILDYWKFPYNSNAVYKLPHIK